MTKKRRTWFALISTAGALILGAIYSERWYPWISFLPQSYTWAWYTCERCNATRTVEYEYVVKYIPKKAADRISYEAGGVESCLHKWRLGISETGAAGQSGAVAGGGGVGS
jgi:hypothetical protein